MGPLLTCGGSPSSLLPLSSRAVRDAGSTDAVATRRLLPPRRRSCCIWRLADRSAVRRSPSVLLSSSCSSPGSCASQLDALTGASRWMASWDSWGQAAASACFKAVKARRVPPLRASAGTRSSRRSCRTWLPAALSQRASAARRGRNCPSSFAPRLIARRCSSWLLWHSRRKRRDTSTRRCLQEMWRGKGAAVDAATDVMSNTRHGQVQAATQHAAALSEGSRRFMRALPSAPLLGTIDARQDVDQCGIRQVSQANRLRIRDGDGRSPAGHHRADPRGGHSGARERVAPLGGRLVVLDHGLPGWGMTWGAADLAGAPGGWLGGGAGGGGSLRMAAAARSAFTAHRHRVV